MPELHNNASGPVLCEVLEVGINNIVFMRSLKQLLLNSWSQMRLIALRDRVEVVLREARLR